MNEPQTRLLYTLVEVQSKFMFSVLRRWGMLWHSWLRPCATSRKVTGLIFHGHNPSGHSMALGLNEPLTEMSTMNTSWGVKAASA